MNILRRIPFHPFLWAIYPILALLAHNISQLYPWMVYRSLVLSLLAAGILFLAFRLILRNWHKAALLVSLLMLLLLSYGHIYNLVEQVSILGINIGRHRYLIGAMLLLIAALLVWLTVTRSDLRSVTQAVNLIAILLLVMPLAQLAWYEAHSAVSAQQAAASQAKEAISLQGLSTLKLPDGQTPPDVYYIILDAYGREDTLRTYFNYDNSPFLNRLEDMGFFVARCSQSNYPNTEYSLSSSLNMDYLQAMGVDMSSSSALGELITHSAVRQAFEKLGYRIIAFESGYSTTEWRDADLYLSPNLHPGISNYLGGVNAFEATLLRTSLGVLIYERFDSLPDAIKTRLNTAYTQHRDRMLYTFDELAKISSTQGPKLVFAHFLAPHEPFVFGPNGEPVVRRTPFTLNHDPETSDPNEYANGYINQLIYINQRVEKLVQTILANSANPPIIILQGDHGPLSRVTTPAARMTNLTAIYLPPGISVPFYDRITPVNIFRLILDGEFGASLPVLEDTSYFTRRTDPPGTFSVIPNDKTDCRP